MPDSMFGQMAGLANLIAFAFTLAIGLLVLYRWKSRPLRFWFALNCFTAAIWNLSIFAGLGLASKPLFLFTFRLESIGWIFFGPVWFIFLAFFLERETLVQTRGRRLFFLSLALPFWLAYLGDPEFFTSVSRVAGTYVSAPNGWFFLLLFPSIVGWALAQLRLVFSSFHHQPNPLIRQRSYLIGVSLLFLYIPALLTDVFLPMLHFTPPKLAGLFNALFCLIVFRLIQKFQLLPSSETLSRRLDQMQEWNQELERRVAERTAELKESEQRWREIFENAQDVIFSEGLDGRILSLNPRVQSLLGLQPEWFIGKTIFAVGGDLFPELSNRFRQIWERQIQVIQHPGDIYQEELSVSLPGRGTLSFALTLSGIFRQEKLVGYLGIARDITESARLRAGLKEYSLKLEQMVAERTRELEATYAQLAETARLAGKAEVAAGVLHNIGNVINSIGVRLEMMRNHLSFTCPVEELGQSLRLLEQNQDRLGPFFREDPTGAKLLPFLRELAGVQAQTQAELKSSLGFIQDQIQHIAEIMAVEQRYHRPGLLTEPTDLNRLVREVLEMMKDSLLRRQVEVETDLQEIPLLKLDRSQMMQVFFNLIKNAAEALEKNPAAERRIKVQIRRTAANEIELTVADNGSGIREEDRPRLFQFGFTTKTEAGGHGFGLHAAANFIQSLGGTIAAESDGPGRGAVFRVCLPLNAPLPEKAEAAENKETTYEPAYLGN